ncbi:hypothetical protein JOF53_007298 [Crossiella equi]|uniref:Ricin B lectin domain-containing protein n=1 Tax=Crossiella equi TaxID=130796 RepID=A0ABS5APE2_9PSEU|nr:RICIN domain-containing protein [Crossiella equi]MBP2478426.1 hypothetical protein [Crossiella equi]
MNTLTKAALCAAGLAALLPATAVAGPQGTAQTFYHNQQTRLYLDDNLQDGLRAFPYNGGIYQQWIETKWQDNTFQFKNRATGRCIEDTPQYGPMAKPCNQSRRQSWYITRWKDLTMEFRNQETGRCLDNYNGLRTGTCDMSTTQSWL